MPRIPHSPFRIPHSRRDWLRLSAMGVAGYSMSGWLKALADQTAADPQRKRACILLWMTGGPSQTDTFDMKPGHRNGGPHRPILLVHISVKRITMSFGALLPAHPRTK